MIAQTFDMFLLSYFENLHIIWLQTLLKTT